MAQLIEQFGGEGFADITDLFARTTMVNKTTSTPPELRTLNVFGTANEKWISIRDRNSTGNDRVFGRDLFPSLQPSFYRETEVSFAMYCAIDVTSDASNSTSGLVNINLGSTIAQLEIKAVPSAASGLVNDLAVRLLTFNGGSGEELIVPSGLLMTAGKVFYITMRIRGENGNANDGAAEVFINEQLIHSDYAIGWHTTVSFYSHSQGELEFNGEDSGADSIHIRNVSIWDGWSTADGVAPKFKHVQDMQVTNVTADPSFTNIGGAASETIALSDSLDTTYLSSITSSSELVLEYTPDPLVSTYNVGDVFTRFRGSRDSIALNTINVALETGVGGAVDDVDHILTAIAPSRENINLTLEAGVALPVNAFQIKITNGS